MKSEISIEQANTLTRKFIVLPVLLSAAVVFVLFYGRFDFSFAESAKHIGFWPWMLRYAGWVTAFIAAVAAGIFIHEGIHGLFIAMFARGGFSSLSFGYDKKTMSPYAHSEVPLRVWQMTVVCLSPLFFMVLLTRFHAKNTDSVSNDTSIARTGKQSANTKATPRNGQMAQ